DDFATGACHQRGKDADAEVVLQEAHRAVREDDVGSPGVEAVDFSFVRAIHGTGPVEGGPVRRRAPAKQQVSRGPGTAGELDVRDLPAPLPQLRPARAFGYQERLRGAVRDVHYGPGVVGREDAFVIALVVLRPAEKTDQTAACQAGIDKTHARV